MVKSILSFAAIIVSVGFTFFNVKPAYEEFQRKQSDLKMLEDTIKDADAIKNTIEQTAGILAEITPTEYERFDTFLPEQMDEIRFVNNLMKAGNARGVVLEDIKISTEGKKADGVDIKEKNVTLTQSTPKMFTFAPASGGAPDAASQEKGAQYQTVKVTFSFVASYPITKLFIGDLERSLNLININSFSFQEDTTASSGKEEYAKTASHMYRSMIEVESYALK